MAALTDSQIDAIKRLSAGIRAVTPQLELLDAYYEGSARIAQLGLAVPPELALFETVANWCRVGVDSVEERLDGDGFRFPSSEEADDDLWRIWQANNLDEESQLAHVDALTLRRSYVCVGANEADEATPLITVESALEMGHTRDPRTRRVVEALRLYRIPGDNSDRGMLYLPNVRVPVVRARNGRWTEDLEAGGRDEHGLDRVCVVPLVNRARLKNRGGVSEMKDIMPLVDACGRSLTNLQLAQETTAVPQRGILGASKGDFVDKDGKPVPVWETYFGAILALANKDAKTFQFTAADLRNFSETVNLYGKIASGILGLPPTYLGLASDTPPSADAWRASESRLVKRAERKQRAFGGSWEEVMRCALVVRGDELDDDAAGLEMLWRDASTPTRAQQADAAVKLYGTDPATRVLPLEEVWATLGYGPTKRKRLRQQLDAEQAAAKADPTLERIARDLAPSAPQPDAVPAVDAGA